MDRTIVEFILHLRRKGLRISVSETQDALRAAALIPFEGKAAAKTALGCTLAKTGEDARRFADLFDRWFDGRRGTGDDGGREGDGWEPGGLGLTDDALLAMAGDPIQLQARLEGPGEAAGVNRMEAPLQINLTAYRILQLMRWDELEEELLAAENRLREEGAGGQAMAERVRRGRESFPRRVREWTRDRWLRNKKERTALDAPPWLLQRAFSELTPEDYQRLDAAMHKMAGRIQGALSVRKKIARKGRLNVRRTMRASLAYGGAPMRLVRDRRLRDRPKLAVLCDVSGSVAYASSFMLHLLFKLQRHFSRVRSFLFVANLGEITDVLKRLPFDEAMTEALRGGPYADDFRSDYGTALRQFAARHADALSPNGALIVLGDARTNEGDPETGLFKWMARKTGRVVWLNPEPRALWSSGDSAMMSYLKHCETAEEVRTPAQLLNAVEGLARRTLGI